MDAEGIGLPATAERTRAIGCGRGIVEDRARLTTRHERPVGTYAAIGESLAEVGMPRVLGLDLERTSREPDDRHEAERAPDPAHARARHRGVRMRCVVERAVRFGRGHLGALLFGDGAERSTLPLDLPLEHVGRDGQRSPPEPFPILVRRMSSDRRAAPRARADDAAHRGLVARMPSTRDVDDVRERIKLFGLVVVFSAVEVEEDVCARAHAPNLHERRFEEARVDDAPRLRARAAVSQNAAVVEPLHPTSSLLTVRAMNAAASVLRSLKLVALLAFALLLLPSCAKYDVLIEKDQIAQEKWSNVEAQLQRRSELIPNLVSTVKASANYEKETLEKITEARAAATSIKLSAEDLTDPAKVKAFQEAQDKISSSAISRLLVANENYPKLQASGQFTDLMKQLEGTENRILRSREEYNASVRDYNAELLKVHGTVVNKATGHPFKPRVFFTATADSQVAPKVSF